VSVGCQAECISLRAFSRWSLVAVEKARLRSKQQRQ
jgi:hypothetical protein